MSERAIGAVLAGGASTLIGEPKALVGLAGRPMIAHVVAAVAEAGLEPIVIAKPDSPVPPLDALVLDEPAEPRHPLLGIAVALRYSAGRPVIVVGCEMPLVPPALLAGLARLEDSIAVVEIDGELQPLLARYTSAVEPVLKEGLAERRPLREVVAGLLPRVIAGDELAAYGDPNRIGFSVNSPSDLELARSLLER
ncbi:MAG: molybdenum cofactor guanylyltransferase [Solirubrobacterales bacterium]